MYRSLIIFLVIVFSYSIFASLPNFLAGVGSTHTCIVKNSRVKCWGDSLVGQLISPLERSDIKELISGSGFSCLLNENGVHCWGDYVSRNTDRPSYIMQVPKDLINPSKLRVVGNSNNACAIDQNNVRCWGRGYSSLLKKLPKLFNRLEDISFGYGHACYIDNGKVSCVGINGSLSIPHQFNSPKTIVAGAQHTCALDDDGMKCWGSNIYGQINVPKNLVNPKQISLGNDHTCVLDDNGMQCWGFNFDNQLDIPKNVSNPKRIWAAGNRTCALQNKRIICWGDNLFRQNIEPKPLKLQNPIKIIAGKRHSCVLDGKRLKCWGGNIESRDYDWLGMLRFPIPLQGNILNYEASHQAACGFNSTEVYCWNGVGKISKEPYQLKRPRLIAVQKYHKCIVDDNGMKCWGSDNDYGELNVPKGMKNITEIDVVYGISCALANGDLQCWGDLSEYKNVSIKKIKNVNNFSIFGGLCFIKNKKITCLDAYSLNIDQIPNDIQNPKKIAVGVGFACVIDRGKVKCWGDRTECTNVPKNLNNVIDLSVNANHACALISNKEVKCWGEKTFGQVHIPF